MGLGIYIKGEYQKKGIQLFKKKESALEKIEKYFVKNSKGIFSDFLACSIYNQTLTVDIHPCEEPAYFEAIDEETIIVSAKTNSVGPGYHAYLVEFVESMGEELNIQWLWDGKEDEEYYCDEAEYYPNKDFLQLQEKMLKWLQSLIEYFVEEKSEMFMISFPSGYPRPKIDYYAISPLGTWTEDWLISTFQPETNKVMSKGREFFIWWNKEPDAEFYLNTAIALLNLDCPWHLPINEKEKKVYALIDKCLTKSSRLNADTSYLTKDWETVKANLTSNQPVPFPQTPYGYKKHIMTHDLPGNWKMDFPGYYFNQDDEGTDVYFDDSNTIRNSSYSRKEPLNEEDLKIFIETFFKPEELKDNYVYYFESEKVSGKSYIYFYINPNDNSDQYWILSGVKSDAEGFIISTICYLQEEDKEWAVDTWKSLIR